jgi:hypothetical protein
MNPNNSIQRMGANRLGTLRMSKSIYSSFTVEGEAELNSELRRRGIPDTIGDLVHDDTRARNADRHC